MRKLSAHYIFPSNRPPIKYGILVLDDEGRLIDIIDTGGKLKEESNTEFYSGILVPGFVNTHCHIELSHLHNLIPRETGITDFVKKIGESRFTEEEIIQKKMRDNVAEIYRSGTSAVGDIVNTANSIPIKMNSQVYWHSFIEMFGLQSNDASRIWLAASELKGLFESNNLSASMSPHAPYSVSQELWCHFQSDPPIIMTMHNQESIEEEQLMSLRKGKLFDWFKKKGFEINSLPPTQKSSLESVIDFIPKVKNLLLIHNTHTSPRDIDMVLSHFRNDQVFWVLCPNSNLYIENSLPEDILNNRKNLQICLGTDSLASNSSLSMLDEMKTIQKRFPSIGLEEIIFWTSINGARALGIEEEFGSFEPGKKPGVVWINNIGYPGPLLTEKSRSVRLI